MDRTMTGKSDNDSGISGLPSRASSVWMENSSTRPNSDPSIEIRGISESWPENVAVNDSCAEMDVLFDSEKDLRRVPSMDRHRRTGSGRRVRRCESARDGSEQAAKIRQKVRRSISERGQDEDGPRRHHHHHHKHHHHRQGSKKSKSSRSQSEHSLGSLTEGIGVRSYGKSCQRQRSVSENFAIELGLKETPEISAKESSRRRIVFAVVVISLAILTASVFLVAITLMLSPAVDAVLRKENEELHKMVGHHVTTPRPLESVNRTILSTASSGHPDG